jgi:butyryl-CoA dehydrogenase
MKKIGLFCLGIAYQKYVNDLENQQEILAGITDICMNAFAAEGCQLRAEKLGVKGEVAREMTAVFIREAMEIAESAAKVVLAACSEGDNLRMNLAVLRRFTKIEPVDAISMRRRIAGRVLGAEKYVL